MDEAIGILETKGLAAAVNAADSILKNTSVKILGKEYLSGGYISLFIFGELSSVNKAITIGKDNAEKISPVLAANIISKPSPEIFKLLNLKFEENEPEEEFSEIADKKIEFPSSLKPKDKSLKNIPSKAKPKSSLKNEKKETELKKNETIYRLRNEALKNDVVENKNSNKEKELNTVNNDLESMNVHQLRKLARNTEKFPIKGREISMANRTELLIYFKNIA